MGNSFISVSNIVFRICGGESAYYGFTLIKYFYIQED